MKTKSLDSMSTSELKEYLKDKHMSQTGDKGTLLYRCRLFEKCQNGNLLVEGQNPCLLKIGDLRKAVSVQGISPIGSQDELLASLVSHLETQAKNTSQVSNANKSSGSSSSSGKVDPIAVAQRILELNEVDDREGILSLGSNDAISRTTPISIMRKAYLKLSLLVHPDKLGGIFENATKAFQALVRAFETLSSPDVIDDEPEATSKKGKSKDGMKPKTLARSNEGCHRTRVLCPRCKQPWSEGTLDGNPDYFYNFLMSGLKQYSCSTCLFEFGCVTAIHKCPFCKSVFEYSPQVMQIVP